MISLHFLRIGSVFAALLALTAAPVTAQAEPAKKAMTFDDLLKTRELGDPQVSPDGKHVVYVVKETQLEQNRSISDLWLLELPAADAQAGSPEARQLTQGPKNKRHPRWSPDGRWIAFESDRDGQLQIWLLPVVGGEARKLTSLSTGASNPIWAPDGKTLAFVSSVFPEFSEKPFAESDKLNAEKADEREKSKLKARTMDTLLYRHWDSWVEGYRQHLFTIAVSEKGEPLGQPKDITPGENDAVPTSSTFDAGDEFAFSSDSRQIVHTAPGLPVREQAWRTGHDLWSVELSTGQRKRLTDNPAANGCPRFSPDGRWLAYRAQSRPGFEADRWQLMLRDLKTGATKSLTAGFDRSVETLTWAPDSKSLYFFTEDLGVIALWRLGLDDAKPEKLYAQGSNAELSLSPDGKALVFAHSSLDRAKEIYLLRSGASEARPLTHASSDDLAKLGLNRPESVTVAGSGGTPVQMWILRPPGFDPAKRYPLVFWVHGGPQNAWLDGWSKRWNAQLWAAQGYVLAMPNPRGSTGFGQKFTDEISRDYGGKVFEDLMACLAYMEKQPYIDSQRMAAAGASFGGYMMNWFQGHTDCFRTIITHAGMFNLTSDYGTTEEVWFSEWDAGIPWETPEAEKFSPHRYVSQFKTPNLVIHGEQDFRVPISQALELFTALQRKGIPSKMLYFPDEGHWIQKPQNSQLWHKTVFDWLAVYLKETPTR